MKNCEQTAVHSGIVLNNEFSAQNLTALRRQLKQRNTVVGKNPFSWFPPPILTLQKEIYTNICEKISTVKFPHDLWNMKAPLGGF